MHLSKKTKPINCFVPLLVEQIVHSAETILEEENE